MTGMSDDTKNPVRALLDAWREEDARMTSSAAVRTRRTDELEAALAQQTSHRNPWQQAVDQGRVAAHLGIAGDGVTDEQAVEQLGELIDWHINVATDPAVNGGFKLISAQQAGTVVPTGWHPIETAPRDNKRPLWIAQFNRDTGELIELDWDASWEQESESWEMPQVYWIWRSANGRVDEPTHWAYMDEAPQPAIPEEVREAIEFAADVLAELYCKYQTKIGPYASQAQLANTRLGQALRAQHNREG